MSMKGQKKFELAEALKTAPSIAEALRRAGLVPAGSNYKMAHRVIKEHGIDVSHMTGQGWNPGDWSGLLRKSNQKRTIPLEEVLTVDSHYNSNDLRRRLISSGLRRHRCERCGFETWNGRPIPLELEHINGNGTDNRLGNLELLCPNSRAQTPTYRGKNIGHNRG